MLLLMVGWGFVQLINTIYKMVRADKDARLKRIATASEQIAGLAAKDISPEVRKSLEEAFLAVADIGPDRVAPASSASPAVLRDEAQAALEGAIVNLRVAGICLVMAVFVFVLILLLRWFTGWSAHLSMEGVQYEKTFGNTTVYPFLSFASILFAATVSFGVSRLFVPSRTPEFTWLVELVISFLIL